MTTPTTSTETALAAALQRQGISRHATIFSVAITKFQNSGGTYQEALDLLDRAYENVDTAAPPMTAPVSAPAATALASSPMPSFNRPIVAATPQRDRFRPGHSARGGAAIASVQPTIAASLFDSLVLPDGRALRAVRYHECPKLAREYTRFSHILMAIHNCAVPQDPTVTLDRVATESQLASFVQVADGAGNAD